MSSLCLGAMSSPVYAVEEPSVAEKRSAVLRDALRKIKAGYGRADLFLQGAGIEKARLDLRGLPDGELLIFEFRLRNEFLKLDGTATAEVSGDTIVFSLRDLLTLLNFPIEYNLETGGFSGWFIREDRVFNLDVASGLIRAGDKEFRVQDSFVQRDDDILVPLADVEEWFGLELEANIGSQLVVLDSDPPLPVMEHIARKRFQERKNTRVPASLPRGDDDYDLISFPLFDISTTSNYTDPDVGDSDLDNFFNIRSANEFAYGALTTNVSGNDTDGVLGVQVSYLRESNAPELLGPLKARRFELGDVLPTFLPITGGAPVETGTRITNLDPFAQQRFPRTQVSGYLFPGWDVELYRNGSLLSFQETDENGFYLFDNVQLFSNENSFRVVAYGPQGEIREENISIPFDANREGRGEVTYDASLTFQDTQTFERFEDDDSPDEGLPHFVGFLEAPITDNASLLLGARYRQEEGEDKAYVTGGIATTLDGVLVNADVAVDEDGEFGSELVVSRRFGAHALRSDFIYNTDDFDPGQAGTDIETFEGTVTLEGPLPVNVGRNPRYSLTTNYDETANGKSSIGGAVNLNTRFQRTGLSQTFNYEDVSTSDDVFAGGTTSISTGIGKNFFRGLANYTIEPSGNLDTLAASWRWRANPYLETILDVSRDIDTDLTRYSAFVNWRPHFATITPRVSVDSENNVTGTLATRFGVTRIPGQGDLSFTREFVSTNGTINAFVYLDVNGNQIFDAGDEPIPDARVLTPQNGQGESTNENGIAFLSRLIPNIVTDVFVDPGSLEDPFWIPARDGVSILPRTGTNNHVDLPIHIAGEIDGTVFARGPDGTTQALRNLTLRLYDEQGNIVKVTRAGSDGFYIFDLVPPGRYSLLVGEEQLPKDIRRPKPQEIVIGFEGTTIFGNDVFLQAGQPDIPTEIKADIEDYKALHPHIDFSNTDYNIVLNLGEYQSRLLTSVVWYRLQSRYSHIFKGAQLYVPPSQSYAAPKTGLHSLRVGLKSGSLDDAYNRCRAVLARGLDCTVEIYPGLGTTVADTFVQNTVR